MKRIFCLSLVIVLLLAGCASNQTPVGKEAGGGLLVSGSSPKTYTRANLEALTLKMASFKGVEYKGVAVSTLLKDAGYDPQAVKALKAIASDGFAVNYDPSQFMQEDFIVAFARADGDLTADDGVFRIVMPSGEGKLNLRMLVELQVIQ